MSPARCYAVLDKSSNIGFVRPTTEGEALEFGAGFVAVYHDIEVWKETRDLAQAKLTQLQNSVKRELE